MHVKIFCNSLIVKHFLTSFFYQADYSQDFAEEKFAWRMISSWLAGQLD